MINILMIHYWYTSSILEYMETLVTYYQYISNKLRQLHTQEQKQKKLTNRVTNVLVIYK